MSDPALHAAAMQPTVTQAAVTEAAAGLADALDAENAALRVMDVPLAIARFPLKAEWSGRLQAALAEQQGVAPSAVTVTAAEQARLVVARLQLLAKENRRLLERAMFVQGRLIATVARAVAPPRTSYGPTAGRPARVPPMTLSARA